MSGIDPTAVRVAGSGAIWRAPAGTTLPTDSVTPYPSGFVNIGYETDGFSVKQDLKTQGITAWQTLELVRLIATGLSRSVLFEALQSNAAVLGMAWGGATSTPPTLTSIGTVTIAAGGVMTSSVAHGLSVGNAVQLGTITGSTGVVAGQTYWVQSVPTGTTFTLSATQGGSALSSVTAGASTALYLITGSYTLSIPNAAVLTEFILGIDWFDGSNSARILLPRCALLTLPEIKYSRADAVRYPLEVQALQPAGGGQPIQVLGFDIAALV
jgi:hypothetical protein